MDRDGPAIGVLEAALARWRGPAGYEGDLIDAADKLEGMGQAAHGAYLAVAGLPECEFFLAGMARTQAHAALRVAYQNADVSVQSRIRELQREGELPLGVYPHEGVACRRQTHRHHCG